MQNPVIDREVLARMNDALVHRGPDGGDLFFTAHVGLGHRRLAIIDIESGAQPMTSTDGRYTIVFNGEIYNYLEIRSELEKEGVVFHTHSDTESLLELFVRRGADALHKLNGMFSFAVWDSHEKKLFAARDRMGKKPFYYSYRDGYFLFASELKALLQNPHVSRTLNPQAVSAYFTYEYVPAPLSIIAGVHKLPAAHFLTFDVGTKSAGNAPHREPTVHRYWSPPLGAPGEKDEHAAVKGLMERLDKAVQYRLISDVPLGVFLSGGIDSSALVALMAEHRAGRDIKTFSIHFDEASYDESLYSDEVARRFGTDHHTEILSASKMLDILPDVAGFLDEPFADGSILPTYLLSRFTCKHVTVALGGDGSDEIFAGYPTFFADIAARVFQVAPRWLQRIAQSLANLLPTSEKNMSLDFKARQFLSGANYPEILRQQAWLSAIDPSGLKNLLTADFQTQMSHFDPLSLITAEMQHCPSKSPGDRLLYFYQKFYLEGDILVKTDRASMACSLEVRAPFLDVDVVDYVSRLPFAFKLKGVTTKFILKRAFNRKLPALITQRTKKGFGIPITGWLKRELRPLLEENLSTRRLQQDGIFNPLIVKRLIEEHIAGKRNHRKALFALLMFQLWHINYD